MPRVLRFFLFCSVFISIAACEFSDLPFQNLTYSCMAPGTVKQLFSGTIREVYNGCVERSSTPEHPVFLTKPNQLLYVSVTNPTKYQIDEGLNDLYKTDCCVNYNEELSLKAYKSLYLFTWNYESESLTFEKNIKQYGADIRLSQHPKPGVYKVAVNYEAIFEGYVDYDGNVGKPIIKRHSKDDYFTVIVQ